MQEKRVSVKINLLRSKFSIVISFIVSFVSLSTPETFINIFLITTSD